MAPAKGVGQQEQVLHQQLVLWAMEVVDLTSLRSPAEQGIVMVLIPQAQPQRIG